MDTTFKKSFDESWMNSLGEAPGAEQDKYKTPADK
jgi:hypothetical protein